VADHIGPALNSLALRAGADRLRTTALLLAFG
jgi:hypothetical protein